MPENVPRFEVTVFTAHSAFVVWEHLGKCQENGELMNYYVVYSYTDPLDDVPGMLSVTLICCQVSVTFP